jgi:glycosyltransferase involved in cell wall biosynthesis
MSYSIYIDKQKTTSGQRFFLKLFDQLANKSDIKDAKVVLFNISAPLSLIIKSKIRCQKIVIRVDSLYADRLSYPFISTFRNPLKLLLKIGFEYKVLNSILSLLANFFNQNYKGFSRIIFADHIIYQSIFSSELHKRYFPYKQSSIICNGYSKLEGLNFTTSSSYKDHINLITTYDESRPSKRIYDLVCFMSWLEKIGVNHIKLKIVGFNFNIPDAYPIKMIDMIRDSFIIETEPKFNEINQDVIKIFKSSDIYITFSYNDACPNAVIEAMSMGLPVVGTFSGGIPDIVGNAGILIELIEEKRTYYPSRYENDFPKINFSEMLTAIESVSNNIESFKRKVDIHFNEFLDIKKVALKYEQVLLKIHNKNPQ